MKNITVDEFVTKAIKELDEFSLYKSNGSGLREKSFAEWFISFSEFCGVTEEQDEEIYDEEYDDSLYYGQDLQFEGLVNRRKYRSFRDDERY